MTSEATLEDVSNNQDYEPPKYDEGNWDSIMKEATADGYPLQSNRKSSGGEFTGTFPKPIDIYSASTEVLEPLDFVLPGVLAGTCVGLIAPGGTGKSIFNLQLGALVSCGADTLHGSFGRPATGPVLILMLEDPGIILQHRIKIVAAHMTDVERIAWSKECTILPMSGSPWNLENGMKELQNASEGKRLVIIDTLRRAHHKDENDNGEMAEILGICEQIAANNGATFLISHHVPKGAGKMNGYTARGASAITDNLRHLSLFRGVDLEESNSMGIAEDQKWRHLIYETIKSNYAPPVEALHFIKSMDGGRLEYIGTRAACMGPNPPKTPSSSETTPEEPTTKNKSNARQIYSIPDPKLPFPAVNAETYPIDVWNAGLRHIQNTTGIIPIGDNESGSFTKDQSDTIMAAGKEVLGTKIGKFTTAQVQTQPATPDVKTSPVVKVDVSWLK